MARREIEVSELVIAIENRIEETGIADAEASRQIGVSPQRLSQWKRGSAMHLNSDLQRSIAEFLRVAPRDVLALLGYDLGSDALGGSRRLAVA